jgi:hypothetical protein
MFLFVCFFSAREYLFLGIGYCGNFSMKIMDEYRELYHTPFGSVVNVNRDSILPNILLKCEYV